MKTKYKLMQIVTGTFGVDSTGRVATPTLHGPQLDIKKGCVLFGYRLVASRDDTVAFARSKGARIIIIYDAETTADRAVKSNVKHAAPAIAEVIVFPTPQEVS
jgi:hypothetical protein